MSNLKVLRDHNYCWTKESSLMTWSVIYFWTCVFLCCWICFRFRWRRNDSVFSPPLALKEDTTRSPALQRS